MATPQDDKVFLRVVEDEERRLKVLHPTPEDLPGCMSVFDTYLSCNVLNSQVKSLYRYGEMASCAHKLDDFKFCMSLKSLAPERRRELWIQRQAEWWAHRRLGKSSEDVWEVRTEPLKNFPLPVIPGQHPSSSSQSIS
ncbi:hypothetical protein BDV98DRAFT_514245 [Pterulicium gracile]|uniref:Uncharacterized protein n=1 Tax=Pterulicium gracile TaxID=1884261 RepID=A0A5C3QA59_9AGAR|nr:hypothetical protein BDV98DRAFT_514245 [Pterula gracilis]